MRPCDPRLHLIQRPRPAESEGIQIAKVHPGVSKGDGMVASGVTSAGMFSREVRRKLPCDLPCSRQGAPSRSGFLRSQLVLVAGSSATADHTAASASFPLVLGASQLTSVHQIRLAHWFTKLQKHISVH